jgi:hypothetical protein
MYTPGPTTPDNLLTRVRRFGGPLALENRPIDRLVARLRRPLDRAWYVRTGRLRELQALGASVQRAAAAASGKRVLVVSLRMWTYHAACEAVMGQALRLRGADVTMLTCGGGQPICEVGWGRKVSPRPCNTCAYFTDRVAQVGQFPHAKLSAGFPWGPFPGRAPVDIESSGGASPLDAFAASSAWIAKSGDLTRSPEGAAIARDFRISIAAVEESVRLVLERLNPDVVVALNGLFAAERAVRAVAADRGIRVVTYEVAPRKGAILFGERHAAPDMVMDGLVEEQLARPLSTREDDALEALLNDRVTGTGSHERYFDHALRHGGDVVRETLGLPAGGQVISAFTNLAWDTALLGKDIAYESQFEWLAQACALVARRENTALVIRVHPAESRWGSAQPVESELAARVGKLPRNVILVRPDEPVSSYGLLAISDLVLCYTTTVGLEAAVRGLPVAVAGSTHYRGRGFTIDIDSHADLQRAIAKVPTMSSKQVELARRYAFAFFFRLMIPFNHVQNVDGRLGPLGVSADELLPGRDPHLDFICERILEGGDFFLPSELALGLSS